MAGLDKIMLAVFIIPLAVWFIVAFIKKIIENRENKRFYSKTTYYDRNWEIKWEYIVSLYLLPKFRALVLNYDGLNDMLVGLKSIFLHIEKKEKNPALLQLLADISPSLKDPIDNLPDLTLTKIFINSQKKPAESQIKKTNPFDIEFMELFNLQKDKFYIDMQSNKNDFYRLEFFEKHRKCIRTNCNDKIYDQPGAEKTEVYEKMPAYYITRIYSDYFKYKFDQIESGFLNKLYPFNHIAYVLDSFHIIISCYRFGKVISCYKTPDGKWLNMFDGKEVKKEDVDLLLSNRNDQITLFYRKME